MGRIVRHILAVVVGLFAGSLVNMGLIQLGTGLVPPPAGADVGTIEGLQAALPLFEPRHFLFPFLAHALGTLAGAIVATLLAPGRSAGPAWAVGVLFLCAGIANVFLLPGPLWFDVLDLVCAYLPMAWLGQRMVRGRAARVVRTEAA